MGQDGARSCRDWEGRARTLVFILEETGSPWRRLSRGETSYSLNCNEIPLAAGWRVDGKMAR